MSRLSTFFTDYKFIKYYPILSKLKFYKDLILYGLNKKYEIGFCFKDEIKNNVKKIYILEKKQQCLICIPEYVGKSGQKIEKYISEEVYCGVVENATIIGGTSCVFKDEKCLDDVFGKDDPRIDVSYGPIMYDYGHKVAVRFQNTEKSIDYGINLVGNAPNNYYHATVELLSRLNYVQNMIEYRNWPLIIDRAIIEIPQLRQFLGILNNTNRRVIVIEEGHAYRVDKLLYISRSCWMPINIKDRDTAKASDFLISKFYIESIRSKIFKTLKCKGGKERKIFVSRKNTENARLINEADVREYFQRNGFEIVYPEEMSFEEQVELFSDAKCVVASTGAAVTNIIYCPEETIIGCIIPREFEFYLYSTIAFLLKQKPLFLPADITKKTIWPAKDKFVLEKKYCEAFLKKIEVMM